MACLCGHSEEEHYNRSRSCEMEGCLCACYEDEDEWEEE